MEFLRALHDLALFDGVLLSKYIPLAIIKHAAIIHSVVNIDFIWMLWELGASIDGAQLDYQTIFSLKYWLNKEENMIIFYNVTSLYYKQHWANVTRQQSIGMGRDSKIQQGVRSWHNLATYPCGSAHVQYLRGSKISFICLAWPEICLKFVQRGWGPGTHVHHFQWSSRFFSQVVSQPPL